MLNSLLGGHTSEALALVSTIDFLRYSPRKYIISEGDTLSARKATELEENMTKLKEVRRCGKYLPFTEPSLLKLKGSPTSYEILIVPRARRVHQPLVSTPPTAIWSLISILKYLIRVSFISKSSFADVLLLNGPGTCFILCIAVYILKVSIFLWIPCHSLWGD